MARNNYVEAHIGEVRCCAVMIPVEKKLLDQVTPAGIGNEMKAFLKNLKEHAEKYDYVGMQCLPEKVMVLFKDINQDNALSFFRDLEADKYVGVKLVSNACYVDERYLEGMYKGVQVSLPPREVEKQITSLLDKYCFDWKFTQDIRADVLAYVGDLGGREVHIMVQHGNKRMAGGLYNGTVRQTESMLGFWKRILADIEQDISDWRLDHQGVCKNIGADA